MLTKCCHEVKIEETSVEVAAAMKALVNLHAAQLMAVVELARNEDLGHLTTLASIDSAALSGLVDRAALDDKARAEVNAILASPNARRYYLTFLANLKASLTGWEAVQSGLVQGAQWSAAAEAQGFIAAAAKPGGILEAAKQVL